MPSLRHTSGFVLYCLVTLVVCHSKVITKVNSELLIPIIYPSNTLALINCEKKTKAGQCESMTHA